MAFKAPREWPGCTCTSARFPPKIVLPRQIHVSLVLGRPLQLSMHFKVNGISSIHVYFTNNSYKLEFSLVCSCLVLLMVAYQFPLSHNDSFSEPPADRRLKSRIKRASRAKTLDAKCASLVMDRRERKLCL